MKYTCEKCGKPFTSEEECIKHETEHVESEKKKLEFDNKRKESLSNLNKLYKDYLNAVEEHEKEYGRVYMYFEDFDLFNPFFGLGLGFGRRNRGNWI